MQIKKSECTMLASMLWFCCGFVGLHFLFVFVDFFWGAEMWFYCSDSLMCHLEVFVSGMLCPAVCCFTDVN